MNTILKIVGKNGAGFEMNLEFGEIDWSIKVRPVAGDYFQYKGVVYCIRKVLFSCDDKGKVANNTFTLLIEQDEF